MNKVLLSNKIFLEKYVSRFSRKKRLTWALIGAAVIFVVALVLLPSLLTCPAASLPIIGAIFAISYWVTGGVALWHAVVMGFFVYMVLGKKKGLQGGSSVEKLARAVGGIVFLPLYEKAVEFVSCHREECESVQHFVRKKIIEWGYTEIYADKQIDQYFLKTPSDIKAEFDQKMFTLKSEKKYEGCSNREIPCNCIFKMAMDMVKEFQQCC